MLGLKLKLGFMSGSAMPALMLNFISTATLDPRITFSRGTNGMVTDATGKLTYAPNNLLLNSATLSTQSVTTAAISYILSFQGTGSIALSGAYSGSLAGTGATDRVYLKFTSTAASLTLTVTGSVTSAQLEAVTYQTTPGTYNATTSAAYYGPRFDYDPVTLAAKGLLIEESRVNLLLNSESFDSASWGKSNSTVTVNAAAAPDGTTSADKLISSATFGNAAQDITKAASAITYTYSIFAKAAELNALQIYLYTPVANNGQYVQFNLSTGTFVSSGATGTGTTLVGYAITSAGNGWYRVQMTVTSDTGTSLRYSVQCVDNGSGTSGIYIWGGQLEAGSFATSYIPTAASSATRNAEVATMTGANFSSWYNASAGTFVAAFIPYQVIVANGVLSVTDGTSSNRIDLRNVGQSFVSVGGINQAFLQVSGVAAGVVNKMTVAYNMNDFSLVANGGTPATDTAGSVPTVTKLQIGALDAGSPFANGHIRSISYYNSRLPNTTLQSYSV